MSTDYVSPGSFDETRDEFNRELGLHYFEQNNQATVGIGFSDPRKMQQFKKVYENPDPNDYRHAYRTLGTMTPAERKALDLFTDYKLDKIDPKTMLPPSEHDADAKTMSSVIGMGLDTSIVQGILDSDNQDAKNNLYAAYRNAAGQSYGVRNQLMEMIDNPDAIAGLAELQSEISLGDSKFRRIANSAMNGAEYAIDSTAKGANQLLTDVYYAETMASYTLGELADEFLGTDLVSAGNKERALQNISEYAEDVRQQEHIPTLQSGSSFYETLAGGVGGMAVYALAGSVNPYVATAMLYTAGYGDVRTAAGKQDPLVGMAMGTTLGAAYGYVNSIGLNMWLRGSRTAWRNMGAQMVRGFTAEAIADTASVLVTTGAYHLGREFNGETRLPFDLYSTTSEALYSGLIGGLSSTILGTMHIPRAAKVAQQQRQFKALHTEYSRSIAKVLATGDANAEAVLRDNIDKLRYDNALPVQTFVRAKDIQGLGNKGINIFLEETGLTQAQFDEAAKFDMDVSANSTDVLMADGKYIIATGQLDTPGITSTDKTEQAQIITDGLNGIDITDRIIAQQTKHGRTVSPEKLAEAQSLIQSIQDSPADAEGRKKISTAIQGRLRQLLKEMTEMPGTKTKSISDFARSSTDALDIAAQKEAELDAIQLMSEFNSTEVLNELDDTYLVRKLRSDLMNIPGLDRGYINSSMHVVKSSLAFLANKAGQDPVLYANTAAVETILSNKSTGRIIDSASQFAALMRKQERAKVVREAKKRGEAPPAVEPRPTEATVPDAVREAMRPFNQLGGRYRTVAAGYIEFLLSQGKDVTDVVGITDTVTRMVDMSNALEQQSRQLRSMTQTEGVVLEGIMTMLGVEGPDARKALDDFATQLETSSKALQEFYKQPDIMSTLEATGVIKEKTADILQAAQPTITDAGDLADNISEGNTTAKGAEVASGAIKKLAPRAFQIRLTGGEYNYSTFPHEWFHVFLNLAKADAPSLIAEFEQLAGGKLFNNDGSASKAQETLASQFERYLLEPGKSLSVEKNKLFNAYSEFLGRVYPSAEAAGLPAVSDDLRNLFNAMFATNEQIKLAKTMNGLTQKLIDSLPKESAARKALDGLEKKARATAEQAARARILGTYIKAEKADLKATAENEVNNQPITILQNELANSKSIDNKILRDASTIDLTSAIKDTDAFNEVIVNLEPFSDMTREEILQQLRDTQDPKKRINSRYNQLVEMRVAELNDALPQDVVNASIHNEDLGIFLDKFQEAVDKEMQLQSTRKIDMMQRRAMNSTAKDQANKMSRDLPLTQALSHKKHIAAFSRALKEYYKATQAGDMDAASQAMYNARVMHYMIDNAVKARKLRDDMNNKWGSKARLAGKLKSSLVDYSEQICTVLGRYGINKKFAKTARDAVELQFPRPGDIGFSDALMDLNTLLPSWIVNLERSGKDGLSSYRSMTYGEVEQLYNALNIMSKVGNSALESMQFNRYKTANEWLEDSLSRMEKLKWRPDTYDKEPGVMPKINRMLDSLGTFSILTQTILSEADGSTAIAGKGFGPLETMFLAARSKTGLAHDLNVLYATKMNPHLAALNTWKSRFNSIKNRIGPVPEKAKQLYGITEWTPETVTMVALNTGNAGNLKLLTDGLGMSTNQITAIMDSFENQAELDGLQGIGDTMEELYPMVDDVLYKTKNMRMKKVLPMPMEYAGGSVRGWYFPEVTEGSFNRGSDFLANIYKAGMEKTPGFTMERMVDKDGKPVNARAPRLDISVLANHIQAATHFAATAETMQDVHKIITDRRFMEMFKSRFGKVRYDDLLQHFGNVANPHTLFTNEKNFGSRALDFLRSRGVDAALGFNFFSGLKQRMDILPAATQMMMSNKATVGENTSALLNSLWHMGVKGNIGIADIPTIDLEGRPVVGGKVVSVDDLDATQFAFYKSNIARSRESKLDQNLRVVAKRELGLERTVSIPGFGTSIGLRDARDAMYAFLKYNDRAAFALVWNAQYSLSMQGKGTFDLSSDSISNDAKAVQDADNAAANMSVNLVTDMTQAQRSELVRPFVTFMTSRVRKAARGYSYVQAYRNGQIGAGKMFAGLAVEAYGEVIMMGLGAYLFDMLFGEDEKKKKQDPDGYGFYKDLGVHAITGTMDVIPIVNMFSGMISKGYEPNIMPLKAPYDGYKEARKAWKAIEKGDSAKAFEHAAYVGGIFGGVPIKTPTRQVKEILRRRGYDVE